jgi:hypothetical protein
VRELVTTLLDILGLLLIAAGIAATAGHWIGLGGLFIAGVIVMAGSWWFAKPPKPKGGSQ